MLIFPFLYIYFSQVSSSDQNFPLLSCISFSWFDSPSGPGPHRHGRFEITLKYTTLGRTPLDERSGRRRDIYLKTHNTKKKKETHCHAPSGIRTFNPSWRASAYHLAHYVLIMLPSSSFHEQEMPVVNYVVAVYCLWFGLFVLRRMAVLLFEYMTVWHYVLNVVWFVGQIKVMINCDRGETDCAILRLFPRSFIRDELSLFFYHFTLK